MTELPPRRAIRSYALRAGRMTQGQHRAIEEHWQQFGLEHGDGLLDIDLAFGRPGKRVLEIGFGMGLSLTTMAEAAPDTHFVGIEVHRPGVGKLLQNIGERKIDNIRIYCHDAVEVLQDCIPAASLDTIQIFFPDPWHKKRHNKRRLIQTDFVTQLASRLKPGGQLHLATDWEDYAQQMMVVLSAAQMFSNTCGVGQFSERPAHRPLTKFELRGERLGHGVWDLVFSLC